MAYIVCLTSFQTYWFLRNIFILAKMTKKPCHSSKSCFCFVFICVFFFIVIVVMMITMFMVIWRFRRFSSPYWLYWLLYSILVLNRFFDFLRFMRTAFSFRFSYNYGLPTPIESTKLFRSQLLFLINHLRFNFFKRLHIDF